MEVTVYSSHYSDIVWVVSSMVKYSFWDKDSNRFITYNIPTPEDTKIFSMKILFLVVLCSLFSQISAFDICSQNSIIAASYLCRT